MLYHFTAQPAPTRHAPSTFLSRGAVGRIGLALAAIVPLWLGLAFVLGWLG